MRCRVRVEETKAHEATRLPEEHNRHGSDPWILPFRSARRQRQGRRSELQRSKLSQGGKAHSTGRGVCRQHSVLNGLGLALSGSKAETSGLIEQYVKSLGCGSTGAAVLGSATKLPARFAALVNGVAIHVDDFDDTQLAAAKDRVYGLLVHPTVCVLPAALATAEVGGKSGKDLLVAYHAGVEVECKIAEAISPRHYEDGFHSTGTCGVF